jgi:hypothetical protein
VSTISGGGPGADADVTAACTACPSPRASNGCLMQMGAVLAISQFDAHCCLSRLRSLNSMDARDALRARPGIPPKGRIGIAASWDAFIPAITGPVRSWPARYNSTERRIWATGL